MFLQWLELQLKYFSEDILERLFDLNIELKKFSDPPVISFWNMHHQISKDNTIAKINNGIIASG